jgi:hypothetical protein
MDIGNYKIEDASYLDNFLKKFDSDPLPQKKDSIEDHHEEKDYSKEFNNEETPWDFFPQGELLDLPEFYLDEKSFSYRCEGSLFIESTDEKTSESIQPNLSPNPNNTIENSSNKKRKRCPSKPIEVTSDNLKKKRIFHFTGDDSLVTLINSIGKNFTNEGINWDNVEQETKISKNNCKDKLAYFVRHGVSQKIQKKISSDVLEKLKIKPIEKTEKRKPLWEDEKFVKLLNIYSTNGENPKWKHKAESELEINHMRCFRKIDYHKKNTPVREYIMNQLDSETIEKLKNLGVLFINSVNHQ